MHQIDKIPQRKNIPCSLLMRLFGAVGLHKVAFRFRRLHCPVKREALVLEIGAGGNPYPRANVLLDAYEDTVERREKRLVNDRPLVLGFAENLPFRDQSFDFIIASHVLEHSKDPDAFIKELVRVGKAGYIETPDAFFERINPWTFHRLEVTDREGVLKIYKKHSWRISPELVDLYEAKMKPALIALWERYPYPFVTRFYWQDKIDYEILNPEVDINWPLPTEAYQNHSDGSESLHRTIFLKAIRFFLSQNSRNRKIDITSLLRCPKCFHDTLLKQIDHLYCSSCKSRYRIHNGIPIMYSQ